MASSITQLVVGIAVVIGVAVVTVGPIGSAGAQSPIEIIAQEALTNVAKHSQAKNVEVILERRADHVLLIIEDDGVGFDPGGAAGAAGQGFGLLGMRERAGLIGATLQIESSVGAGTTIFVRMAVASDRREADHA